MRLWRHLLWLLGRCGACEGEGFFYQPFSPCKRCGESGESERFGPLASWLLAKTPFLRSPIYLSRPSHGVKLERVSYREDA